MYRRYRPDRFEEVIGQDHVTVPLRTALAKDRVNHAYLFSGPRGCGKTTSARILARCLNCAQGPTPTPCGECDSCRDLATGGPGSLDVLEIDAASHGGVEDARGLRERATFAPVRDRYKILIIDEAHMVTAAGFNALLKIVEEPPEHLKFIFATTEPEKVIGTIRSRTHHYPFRLVPPEPLIAHLEQLCAEEGVSVEKGVLPLVVRAGTGSVRDTLSVLDQLIAGAQDGGVSYELAVSLLGFTPEALLDDVIDAVAADDTPTVFRVVDRVVQSGQDPRRFVEDLLDRFRDLVIARALPEEAGAILHGMPEDQVRRLSAQAAQLSRAELSRLADVTNLALTDMVGATSPRLHLELLMARLLLPASDDTHRGLAARLEALERRLELGGVPVASAEESAGGTTTSARPGAPAAAAGGSAGSGGAGGGEPLTGAALARAAMRRPEAQEAPTPPAQETAQSEKAPAQPEPSSKPSPVGQAAPPAQPAQSEHPRPERWAPPAAASSPEADAPAQRPDAARPEQPAQQDRPQRQQQTPPPAPAGQPEQRQQQTAQADRPTTAERSSERPAAGAPEATPTSTRPQAAERPAERPQAEADAAGSAAPSSAAPAPAPSQVEKVRRAWPDILAALEDASRLMWMIVKDNASVAGYDGSLLTIGFQQDGPRQMLLGRGGDRVLAEAVHQVLGIRPQLDLILGGDAPQGGSRPAADARPQAGGRPAAGPAASPAAAAPAERPQGRPQQGQAPGQEETPSAPRAESRADAPTSRPDAGEAAPTRQDPRPGADSRQDRPQQQGGEADRGQDRGQQQGRGQASDRGPAQGGSPSGRPTGHAAVPTPGRGPSSPAPAQRPTAPQAASTTPPGAPPSDGWGRADEEPPAWDDAPPPEEDPWDSLPEFDPNADMDDSDGPEGWTPPAAGQDDAPVGAAGWDGPVPATEDWGAPPQGGAPAPGGRRDERPAAAHGSAAPSERPAPQGSADAGPAAETGAEPSAEEVRRAYDPGPLVREEEHTIPVFARPEAELRAEFAQRFGATRPAGFDDGAGAGAVAESTRAAAPSPGPDDLPPGQGDDPDATARRDAHPAASASGPSSAADHGSSGEPTADGTPDPGVPAEDHEHASASDSADDGSPEHAAGSGHPASMFPRLMERVRAGGPLEPPVNAAPPGGATPPGGGPGGGAGPSGPGSAPGSDQGPRPGGAPCDAQGPGAPGPDAPRGGRPSAAALGARPGGETGSPAGASAPPSLDARAAAIRAAREAAQGRGPARTAGTGPAAPSAPAVGWEDEVASDDDVALEDSGLVGRAVVERVLGARLLEERANSA
nr:DNA polymerase III subunit gamma and tau [Micrococcus endophyticus]